ncbi:C4-dicarboxylate ABC transporter [Gallibacterium salpingitidis]|uniref:TRAP transporter small permease protein n=1 Tax=Gallibacterium salpingitidis TaxID=505341 RepID=A0A1A7Q0S2_9PAST|nr:TRAP transporter small permease [Gallibacterium salpingitidis]OBW95377.1 C4-dicarboxylate ABC transporter [Gallibacterium salpingitidis]OBX08443.1 C4-dicarboxylate ABC transporter [Gallibacterium salpingitidis]
MSETLSVNQIPILVDTPVGRVLYQIARKLALLGGFIFLILIAISLYSLVGRKLGFGGVVGDIELVQAGSAVAGSLFLPFCTIMYEHLKVDFFTMKLPKAIQNKMDALADLALFAVAILLVYRMIFQSMALYDFAEVTALMSIPVWVPNMLMIPGFILMALCSLYYCVVHATKKEV